MVERIYYDHRGMRFDYIHSKQYDDDASLVVFVLLTRTCVSCLINRKNRLPKLAAKARDGTEYAEHLVGNGNDVYRAA